MTVMSVASPNSGRRCVHCRGPATIIRRYSGEALCEQCFRDLITRKVRDTITEWRMLDGVRRIAVAFSGGKDSTTLLSILVGMREQFPLLEIVAITLDEGIAAARKRKLSGDMTTQLLGVKHVVSSYDKLFSVTLDDVVKRAKAAGSPFSPCTYCGAMRRQGLNILARQVGAERVAFGHNLDDEVQSGIMNLLQGNLRRLVRLTPVQQGQAGALVPRIKPLYNIPEQEVLLYAQGLGFPYYKCPCVYRNYSLRTEIRTWLNELETRRPGTKQTVAGTLSKIAQTIHGLGDEPLGECAQCGEPTPNRLCAVCQQLADLGYEPRSNPSLRANSRAS